MTAAQPAALPSADASADAAQARRAANLAALEQAMRRDDDGLQAVTHPDGRIAIDLQGRHLHMSAAVRDANGNLRIQCFTDFGALSEAVAGNVDPSGKDDHELAAY